MWQPTKEVCLDWDEPSQMAATVLQLLLHISLVPYMASCMECHLHAGDVFDKAVNELYPKGFITLLLVVGSSVQLDDRVGAVVLGWDPTFTYSKVRHWQSQCSRLWGMIIVHDKLHCRCLFTIS